MTPELTPQTPNIPLLRKVLEQITDHPEEWDQTNWGVRTPCGTAYCFAGWALTLGGHHFEWTGGDDNALVARQTTDGVEIWALASDELGLTPVQIRALFKASNDLNTLWFLVEEISGGEITPGPEALKAIAADRQRRSEG